MEGLDLVLLLDEGSLDFEELVFESVSLPLLVLELEFSLVKLLLKIVVVNGAKES